MGGAAVVAEGSGTRAWPWVRRFLPSGRCCCSALGAASPAPPKEWGSGFIGAVDMVAARHGRVYALHEKRSSQAL